MRICHLLASDTVEDDLVQIRRLRLGLDSNTFQQFVMSLDADIARWASRCLDAEVASLHLRLGGFVGSAGPGALDEERPHLVHLWSADPAPLNSLSGVSEMAVVMRGSLVGASPTRLGPYAKHVLRRATVVCDTQAARSSLLDLGLKPAICRVVPPGISENAPFDAGPSPTRESLGLPDDQPVLLTPPPPSRPGGHYYAVWATALLQQLYPEIRLVVPGGGKEQLRLERFVRSFDLARILVCTGRRYRFEQLLPLADVVVAPALKNIPIHGVVRAMGSGTAVVAGDVRAMRSCLEHERTGLLVRPSSPTRVAGAALQLIEDGCLRNRIATAARAEADSAYPLSAFLSAYHEIYDRAYARARTLAMGRPR